MFNFVRNAFAVLGLYCVVASLYLGIMKSIEDD